VTLDAIRGFVESDLNAVDDVIRARLNSEVALIRQVAEYIVGGGGKRLRPLLLLLSAGAFGARGRHCHELAAVVEFIHTATLLHDDVVDESDLRRGRSTANALFGNSAAVLVGDFVYSRAFQMMVGVDNMRVLQVLADATNVIAEGEVMQLMNCHNPDIREEEYLGVIRCKTAKLFEAATRLGAILGGAPREQEKSVADYGMRLGTAFQLIDDVLDYSGEQAVIGKNLGDDLAEGKPTLPIIHALRHGSGEEKEMIRRAIEAGDLSQLEPIIHAIDRTGGLDYATRVAQNESELALVALAPVPESEFRMGLAALARFAANHTT
jgi:octaprenyl-diphosphate synthase